MTYISTPVCIHKVHWCRYSLCIAHEIQDFFWARVARVATPRISFFDKLWPKVSSPLKLWAKPEVMLIAFAVGRQESDWPHDVSPSNSQLTKSLSGTKHLGNIPSLDHHRCKQHDSEICRPRAGTRHYTHQLEQAWSNSLYPSKILMGPYQRTPK